MNDVPQEMIFTARGNIGYEDFYLENSCDYQCMMDFIVFKLNFNINTEIFCFTQR